MSVTFASLPIIRMDLAISRGTRPAVARLRVPHTGSLAAAYGPLTFTAEDTVSLQMVPDLATIRYEHTPGKRRYYTLLAYDRRAAWKRAPVEGGYNIRYRDGTIKPSTEKTVGELGSLLLQAAGETLSSTADISGVKPQCEWRGHVSEELDALCEALPIHVCWKSDGSYTIEATGEGDTLNHAAVPAKIPDYTASLARGPKTIRTVCAPTWYQCRLLLEAVGLDSDGEWKLIDNLSYKPLTGWEKEWPELMTGVAQAHRHLALDTVFRCYRIAVQPVPGSSTSVTDIHQFLLDPHKVEMGGTGDAKFLQPAAIYGEYYPWSHLFKNTGTCTPYPGSFRLDSDQRMVWFDQPVFKAGNCIEAAVMYLETGFHLLDEDGIPDRYTTSIERAAGEGEKAIFRADLWQTVISNYASDCTSPTSTNTSSVAEAGVYASKWAEHYDTITNIRDVPAAGVHTVSLSGNIAQISYRVGGGLTPETRASEHYEHRTQG